jgi:acyl transferase domain-containing protein
VIDRCDEALRSSRDHSLLSVLHAADGTLLDQTGYTQPALYAIECALAEVWKSWGIAPHLVLGHSVGEYAAAYVAGVFSLEEGLQLIAERARLMQSLPSGGSMAAVLADEARVRPLIVGREGELSLSAVNAADSVVVSGTDVAVSALVDELARQGIEHRRLNVSHAFHSPLMAPIEEAFEARARQTRFASPRPGLVSNLTGRVVTDARALQADYWRRQLREPVRFMEGMRTLQAEGCTVFVEIGPAPVLVGLGRRCVTDGGALWAPSLRHGRDDWSQMLESLAALHVHGVEVDWEGFDRDRPRRKVRLPTYPWQRKAYWIEWGQRKPWAAESAVAASPRGGPEHALLGRPWPAPAARPGAHVWESVLDSNRLPYVDDHRIAGTTVVPVAVFLDMAMAAGHEAAIGNGNLVLEGVQLHKPLYLPPSSRRALQVSLSEEGDGAECAVHSRPVDDAGAAWTLHMTSRMRKVQ